MIQFFDVIQQAQLFQIGDDGLAAVFAGHAFVLRAGFGVHRAVEVHDHNGFQVVALAHFKVVRVVGRRNLYGACPESDVDIVVGNDFDFAVYERDDDLFADKPLHPFVFRIYGDGRIAHDRFRTGRGDHDVVVFADDGVFNIPQMALYVRMVDFDVAQSRMAMGAPVRNALALINQALFIKRHEYFADGAGADIVHRKALAAPVARRAQTADLLFNTIAVLFLPGPYAFQKFFAANVVASLAFFFSQLLFYLYLRRDAGMVRPRNPGHVIAFHALKPDENILQCIVQGMAHVQLPRDVRRRHDDAEGLSRRIGVLMKIPVLFPEIIPFHFNVVRRIRA